MSTEKVTCHKCRGRKTIAGMGGIVKDCPNCKGVGTVAPFKVEMCSLEDIFPGVSEGVATMSNTPIETVDMFEQETAASEEIEVVAVKENVPKKKEATAPMYAGLSDEFMIAILDEPRMDPLEWAKKYQHVDRLFGKHPITGEYGELVTKVQRASQRALYAQSQPRVERKVDMLASMDKVSENDKDYIVYKAKEDANIKKATT